MTYDFRPITNPTAGLAMTFFMHSGDKLAADGTV